MRDGVDATRDEFDADYRARGFAAQRRYPNEELLRFLGSYYFSLSREERAGTRVLEVGCGSGANLWMIAHEGFEAHGVDLSPEALKLCERMLRTWGATARLAQSDMTELGYSDSYFDVVVDVVAGYCLDESAFARFLDQVTRILKPGGRFFCFTPSKNSDCFRDPGPSRRIDASTLEGMQKPTSPYYGQLSPFRFTTTDELAHALQSRGFKILRNERIGRTYFQGSVYFEFVSTIAQLDGETA